MFPLYLAIAALFAAALTATDARPKPWPPESMPKLEARWEQIIEYPKIPAPSHRNG